VVLANLLPGLREIRAPVVSGYLWLIFLFLALHSALPSRHDAGSAIQPIFDLGDRLSVLGLATVTGVAAYLIGSAMQELLKSVGRWLAPRKPLYAEPGVHTTDGGRRVLMTSLEVRMDGITRKLFQIALSPGERGIDEAPRTRAILDELPLTRALLLGEHPELVGELDRLQAEADLRITVSIPLAALGILLFVLTWDPWWLFAVGPAGLLLWQGFKRQHEAGDFLAKVLRIGKVDAPLVSAFEVSVDAALERNKLEWQLKAEKDGGDAGAAFRLGNLQASAGEREDALESLRFAAEKGVTRAYAEMGALYVLLEDHDEAERMFRDGAKRGDRKASDLLAALLNSQNRDEEALEAVKEAPESDVGEVVEELVPKPAADRSRISDYRRRMKAGDVKAAINLGLLLERHEDWEEAITVLREATVLDEDDASAWIRLGGATAKRAQFIEAQAAYERALAIQERKLGSEHLEVGLTANNLGLAMLGAGERTGARKMFERALPIEEQELGSEHLSVANTLELLGASLDDQKRALALQERALAIKERTLDRDDAEMARSLGNIGNTWSGLGEYKKARELQEQALAIKEKVFGPDHLETALTLGNLGIALRQLGKAEESRKALERVLAIEERELEPDSHRLASTLVDFGDALRDLGEYSKARELQSKALAIEEAQLGRDHPSTGEALQSMGETQRAMGDLGGALISFQRALAIFEAGEGRPDIYALVLRGLGETQLTFGRADEATDWLTRALAMQEEILPAGHPELVSTLRALAAAHMARGDAEAATHSLRRAEEIEEDID
jgi:tetratricopeptide (TPR) repeat protein